jgi:hypothetical protein
MGTSNVSTPVGAGSGNPVWTLTGAQFMAGTAIDNTQTDIFQIFGGGNTILEQYGNLLAVGGNGAAFGSGWDADTTVMIGGTGVTDSIALDGGNNSLGNAAGSPLSGATVTFTVTGLNGTPGGNRVNLANPNGTNTVTLSGGSNTVTLSGPAASNTVTSTGSATVSVSGATNTVTIGSGTVTLTGTNSNSVTVGSGTVTANGNTTNTVTFGAGASTANIGGSDDNMFGYGSGVTLSGNGNTVFGGDENFTIAGGASGNLIWLGDGTNTVSLTGTGNLVAVGGGVNTVNAGGSSATVAILGQDGTDAPAFTPESDDTPYVTASPTDTVTIAGASDFVTATYENLNVIGMSVTAAATVTADDGNDSVLLGGTGGDSVTLGNGGNTIDASGNGSIFTVGNGVNGITLSGNNNTVQVIPSTGGGTDIVQLGFGANNNVALGNAGGSVTDWAPFGTNTTVNQTGMRAVTVNLHSGTGAILLGDGADNVTAGGNGASIIVGSGNDTVNGGGSGDFISAGLVSGNGLGNDTVTANGAGTAILLANGNNTVVANGAGDGIQVGGGANNITANGSTDTITGGNGNNTPVIANGAGDVITFGSGNNNITAGGGDDTIAVGTVGGSGNNTIVANGGGDHIAVGTAGPPATNGVLNLTATGTGDTISVIASPSSSGVGNPNLVSIGSGTTLSVTGGTATIQGVAGDTFHLNGLGAGSEVYESGNGNLTFIGSNADAIVHLNPVATSDTVTVQALTGNGQYSGTVEISGFASNDVVDLQSLVGANGTAFSGLSGTALFNAVTANMTFGSTQDTLALQGGGSIAFDMPVTAFTTASFLSSSSHGVA